MISIFQKGFNQAIRLRDYFVVAKKAENNLNQFISVADMVSVVLVLIGFHLFYLFLYFIACPSEIWSHFIAVLEIVMMTWTLYYMRRTGNTAVTSIVLVTSGLVSTIMGLIHYGGIFSVDLLWLIFSIITTFLFGNRKLGIVYTLFTFVFVFGLWYLESIGFRDYKADIVSSDGVYEVTAFLSVSFLIAFLLLFFVNKITRLSNEVNTLNQNQVSRLNQMLEEKTLENETVRQQVVQDFHDLMGNKLASIASISESIKIGDNKPEDFVAQIKQINQLSKGVYENTKDFIWTMDVLHNNLFFLYLYLKDFSEQLFNYSAISFLCEPIEDVFETETRTQHQCSQLILMVKEIMTNVLAHSQASKVELHLYNEQKNIFIEVKDDGVGFDFNGLKRINGLNNIKERARQMDTSCSITSSVGIGTRVIITIPN